MARFTSDIQKPENSEREDVSKHQKLVVRILVILSVCIILGPLLLFCCYSWWQFHPHNPTPVVGPAGPRYKAFIEQRGFGDIGFYLCVSDWPHTFPAPITLGSVPFSEPPYDGIAFWSMDGTVLAIRKKDNTYHEAYDYQTHELIRYRTERIEELMASRGGLGPKHERYPDAKGDP